MRGIYDRVRKATLQICASLEVEDHVVQPHWFVSPPKWHLGHTTWFFDNFCLKAYWPGHAVSSFYHYVFNSYYESQGAHVPQSERGKLSRPSLADVHEYRRVTDEKMAELFERMDTATADQRTEFLKVVELGLNHEQQHQELLHMDIQSILFHQPGWPSVVVENPFLETKPPRPKHAVTDTYDIASGVHEIGFSDNAFAYDNERPRHRVYLENAKIQSRLVRQGEFLEFIQDRGYQRPELWLSDGWTWVQREKIEAPLYWLRVGNDWRVYTRAGLREVQSEKPVAHVSYFEADAFARWKGGRLPTEGEWEVASASSPLENAQLWDDELAADVEARETYSLHGSLWQWTQSAYLPYPGYVPFAGDFAEYNGKFMNGQMVLRGGCFATPRSHYRPTYRNFFSPETRWPYTGFRLAR